METFNIVEAIESNPNTKLSSTYNNKLIEKIKNNFTLEEQKLYIVSFYSFLNYDEFNDYVVDLDDVWKWLGFVQKSNAKVVLLKHFIKDIDYKVLLMQPHEQNKKGSGGHNKETILLNINTFKLLCLKADTEKAKQIHKYYVKLESILHKTLQEECEEFKNQVLQLEKDKQKLIVDKFLEKHNLLLKEYGTSTPLVYLVRIKSFDNKTFGLKIGESRQGILERYSEHKSKYDECIFMDCFRVLRSKDFESFLHSHPDIKPYQIKDLPGHEGEKELFLCGGELPYNKIITIINSSIHNYNNFNSELEKLQLENENLKLMLELNKIPQTNNIFQSKQIVELIEINKKMLEEIGELKKSNQEIQLKLNNIQTKNIIINVDGETNKNFGNRIQKINPENGNLIKYYESISEVIKENSEIKRSSLAKAIKNNTIYNGYRWIEVSRDLDPKQIYNYKPTKEIKTQQTGYIAKLNKEQTEILNVYLDRKVASMSNGYESHSALDIPVKNKKETKGFYYMLYSDCDKKLTNTFEKSNGKVFLYLNGIGQFDTTKKLVNTYCSKYDCARANNMADRTLNKILDKNVEHNGFSYKYIGSKTQSIQ
jgi:hypothetical protein